MALAPVLLAADSVGGQTSFLRDIPPGKYEAIAVRFGGDASSGTFAIADLGRIRLTEAGRDLVAADADNIRSMNCLKGGSSRVQAVLTSFSAATCMLPRGFYDGNVHQVIEADVVQVQIQFGASFTTKFTGSDPAQIRIYGLVREMGEMAYNLLLYQQDQTYGSGTFTLPVRNENVIALYIVAPTGGDLDRVRVVKDGTEFANVAQGPNVYDNDLVSISDVWNKTDVPNGAASFVAATGANADSDMAEIAIADPGEVGEYLSDDIVIEYTCTPATTFVQETLIMAADFTPTKLRQSKVEAAAIAQRKIARKNTLGRGRPIQTLRIQAEP